MAENRVNISPVVTPSRPKGSGSKAPWIALVLIVVAVLAVFISIWLGVRLVQS